MGELVRKMHEAGAPPEAIAIAVEAVEAEQTKMADTRAKRAAQKAKERDRRATVARHDGDNSATVADTPALDKEKPPTPPKEIKPSPDLIGSETRERSDAFGRHFWPAWPNKVAKPEAEKAFARCWRELDAILDGVRRYVENKPADRPWMHPSTFLNQRRWEDEYPAEGSARGPPSGWSPPRQAEATVRMRTAARLFDEAIANERDETEPDDPFEAAGRYAPGGGSGFVGRIGRA